MSSPLSGRSAAREEPCGLPGPRPAAPRRRQEGAGLRGRDPGTPRHLRQPRYPQPGQAGGCTDPGPRRAPPPGLVCHPVAEARPRRGLGAGRRDPAGWSPAAAPGGPGGRRAGAAAEPGLGEEESGPGGAERGWAPAGPPAPAVGVQQRAVPRRRETPREPCKSFSGEPPATPLVPAGDRTRIECLPHAKPHRHCWPGWTFLQRERLLCHFCPPHKGSQWPQHGHQGPGGRPGQSWAHRRCTAYSICRACGSQQAGWEPGPLLLN